MEMMPPPPSLIPMNAPSARQPLRHTSSPPPARAHMNASPLACSPGPSRIPRRPPPTTTAHRPRPPSPACEGAHHPPHTTRPAATPAAHDCLSPAAGGTGPTSLMISRWQLHTRRMASGVPMPAPRGSPAGPNQWFCGAPATQKDTCGASHFQVSKGARWRCSERRGVARRDSRAAQCPKGTCGARADAHVGRAVNRVGQHCAITSAQRGDSRLLTPQGAHMTRVPGQQERVPVPAAAQGVAARAEPACSGTVAHRSARSRRRLKPRRP
jgi:hypothetical protein